MQRGEKAAQELGARFVQLDVTDDESVQNALAIISEAEGALDVLVHNAGIQEFGAVDGPMALRAFDTNAVGIVRVTEAALPLLHRSANPTVVTVSSSAGSFWAVTNPERPEFALTNALYSASKAAATMLTVHYAKLSRHPLQLPGAGVHRHRHDRGVPRRAVPAAERGHRGRPGHARSRRPDRDIPQ